MVIMSHKVILKLSNSIKKSAKLGDTYAYIELGDVHANEKGVLKENDDL